MKRFFLLAILALTLGACIVSPPPTAQAPQAPARSTGHFDYAERVLRDLDYVYMGTQETTKFYHAPETASIAFGLKPDGKSIAAIADFTLSEDWIDGEDMADIQWAAFDALGIMEAYFWLSDQEERLPPSGGSASGRCGPYYCYADMEDWVLILTVSE